MEGLHDSGKRIFKYRVPKMKEKQSGSENELSDNPVMSDDGNQGQKEASDVVTFNGVVPMQSYMKIVNKLQSLLRSLEQDGIRIPTKRIAVVGGQSTGKSSLLEQIAGGIFLPRGTGMTTKCPVILQFITSETKSYFVEGTEYNDANGVERAIRTKYEFAARRDGGISNDPITVEISLPTAPNMTLVDLPGLIEVALNVAAQDQDSDLPHRIEEMVLEQIANNQTIILAVASADAEFQNSKSIKLAQLVDPHGSRTIAVVTKLDKVDLKDDEEKQSLRKTLIGSNVTVKLGVVGVVNRTKRLSFDDAKKNEGTILKTYFPEIAAKHGIEFLCNHLSKLQMHQIQHTLHTAMREVELNLKEQLNILDKLGIGEFFDKQAILKRVAMELSSDYRKELEGGNRHINNDNLCGSVKIKEILGPKFAVALDNLNSENQATNKRIINAIYNHRGTEGFYHLAEMLEAGSLKTLDAVYLVMRDEIPLNCFSSGLSDGSCQANKYPKLQNELNEVIQKLLARGNEDVKDKIKEYIRSQAYCSRTCNGDFLSKSNSGETTKIDFISPIFLDQMSDIMCKNIQIEEGFYEGQNENGDDPDDPIHLEKCYDSGTLKLLNPKPVAGGKAIQNDTCLVQELRYLINLYYDLVKAQVLDYVPKVMKLNLIYHASENIIITMMNFCQKVKESQMEKLLIGESQEIDSIMETQQEIEYLEQVLIGFKEIEIMFKCGIFI